MDHSKIPNHVVIIPDGNRRWAKSKGQPAFFGHLAGVKSAEKIIRTAFDLEIPCLTMWGASVANVTERSKLEIKFLLQIFKRNIKRLLKTPEIEKNKVRVKILGEWEKIFPADVKKPMYEVMEKTKNYKNRTLNFLLAYDGREEMLSAVKKIAELKEKNPALEVTRELMKNSLYTKDLPPVDLVIRTGGEPPWSAGLMMWDVAEARLYFTPTLWPAFDPEEFKQIVASYSRTERRFGK